MTKLEKNSPRLYNASQWRLIVMRFKKSRIAVVSGFFIAFLMVVVIFPDFFAVHDPRSREITAILANPTRVHFARDGRIVWPYVYGIRLERNLETFQREYSEDTTRHYNIRLFVRGYRYKTLNIFESDIHLVGVENDGRLYLLGTDQQGRDVFSRVIYGTRLSLTIGLMGVSISFAIGIILGSISGYFGGVADTIIQRIIEILTSIPTLPLWMGLSAALPLGWSVVRVFFGISVILSLLSWPRLAREVRGKFLSLKTEDFIMAAKLDGLSAASIVLGYMLPSFTSHIVSIATLTVPAMILAETALSFLGIGLQPPAISWGVLLQAAQKTQTLVVAPWLLLPGILVITTILAFNFFGDGLRDAADPYKV